MSSSNEDLPLDQVVAGLRQARREWRERHRLHGMAGRNYGLSGLRYALQILVPAALPAILAGLRIAWAFAWRTLIAAELVFGASSGRGGLGWYIFQNRN